MSLQFFVAVGVLNTQRAFSGSVYLRKGTKRMPTNIKAFWNLSSPISLTQSTTLFAWLEIAVQCASRIYIRFKDRYLDVVAVALIYWCGHSLGDVEEEVEIESTIGRAVQPSSGSTLTSNHQATPYVNK